MQTLCVRTVEDAGPYKFVRVSYIAHRASRASTRIKKKPHARAASFLCLLFFFQDISDGGDDEDEVGGDPCAGVAEADGGKRRV